MSRCLIVVGQFLLLCRVVLGQNGKSTFFACLHAITRHALLRYSSKSFFSVSQGNLPLQYSLSPMSCRLIVVVVPVPLPSVGPKWQVNFSQGVSSHPQSSGLVSNVFGHCRTLNKSQLSMYQPQDLVNTKNTCFAIIKIVLCYATIITITI